MYCITVDTRPEPPFCLRGQANSLAVPERFERYMLQIKDLYAAKYLCPRAESEPLSAWGLEVI